MTNLPTTNPIFLTLIFKLQNHHKIFNPANSFSKSICRCYYLSQQFISSLKTTFCFIFVFCFCWKLLHRSKPAQKLFNSLLLYFYLFFYRQFHQNFWYLATLLNSSFSVSSWPSHECFYLPPKSYGKIFCFVVRSWIDVFVLL